MNHALLSISKMIKNETLHGMIKRFNKTKFTMNKVIKKIGVAIDFLINFNGVLIIKQEHPLGSFSICLNSYWSYGTVIESISSIGFFPFLSLTFLEAPLIKSDLTGLELRRISTLLIAKCNGV